MQVKFKKIHPDAILPSRSHTDQMTGDSGFDIYAVENQYIAPGSSAIINTGIQVAHITEGYWFRIQGRSGLGFKFSIQPHFGIIDNGYRGNLGVKLYNLSNQGYIIKSGDKIAQFVVYKLHDVTVSWAQEKTQTSRGQKGFGSSDVQ